MYEEMNVLERIEYLMNEGMTEEQASYIVNSENGGDEE